MQALYIVELDEDEKNGLKELLRGGSPKVRMVKRAQIILAADQGQTDEEIAESVNAGTSTVFRTRRKYVEGGLEHALSEKQRLGGKRKLSNKEEALVSALACSKPPSGRAKWTLELLAGEVVQLTQHDTLSKETVRRRLEENDLKPWRQTMWCIPKVDAEYVARMEDILDLYEEPANPKRPVVNFDETIRVMLQQDAHLIFVSIGENSTLEKGWGRARQSIRHPVAYTNPIYVDVDHNGFQASGDTLGHPLMTAK